MSDLKYGRLTIDTDVEDLSKKEFTFTFLDGRGIVLNSYFEMERETKRHKFKVIKRWSRLNSRDNNTSKPDLDLDIQTEAVSYFRQLVKMENEE